MIGRRSHDDAQSFEEAWSGRTPRDEHIAELVRFVEGICEAAAVEPSMQFRDSLRTQLMSEAATTLVPIKAPSRTVMTPARETRPLRRRVAGLTSAVVASAGVIGLVSSSASAVPGEMLYPVKRGVESVELALHRDDASRGSLQLAQASERLAEASKLSADNGSEQLISQTLDDFASRAESGSTSLFGHYTDSGEQTSISEVNDFAVASAADLSALSAQLPPGADESFDAATATISDLAIQASSLCASCVSGDVQQLVSTATGLSEATPATGGPVTDADKPADDPNPNSPRSSSSEPAAPAPAPRPIVVLSSTPTADAPALADVTDPVVGGLLGDANQEGLVPGLLNGLLGGTTK